MDPMNDVTAHLTTGAVAVYAIEALKQWPQFRWLTADSATVNRVISALAAAMIAFGISATGDVSTGWTIHIPSGAILMAGLWEWVKQVTVQQVLYQSVVEPKRVKV